MLFGLLRRHQSPIGTQQRQLAIHALGGKFVAQVGPDGNFHWAFNLANRSEAAFEPMEVVPTGSGVLYAAGTFDRPSVFGTKTLTPVGKDAFLAKMNLPLHITSLTAEGDRHVLKWSGGRGPFDVQRRPVLGTGLWEKIATTATREFKMPLIDPSGFLRIVDNLGN